MKNRISPHVNIYKFPITAISSISTRLTGLYLTGLFVSGGIYCLQNNKNLEEKYKSLSTNNKRIINMSIIIPSTYHTFGGIRHFIWDKFPHLLTNVKVQRSSIGLISISILSSFIYEKYVINNDLNNIFV